MTLTKFFELFQIICKKKNKKTEQTKKTHDEHKKVILMTNWSPNQSSFNLESMTARPV